LSKNGDEKVNQLRKVNSCRFLRCEDMEEEEEWDKDEEEWDDYVEVFEGGSKKYCAVATRAICSAIIREKPLGFSTRPNFETMLRLHRFSRRFDSRISKEQHYFRTSNVNGE